MWKSIRNYFRKDSEAATIEKLIGSGRLVAYHLKYVYHDWVHDFGLQCDEDVAQYDEMQIDGYKNNMVEPFETIHFVDDRGSKDEPWIVEERTYKTTYLVLCMDGAEGLEYHDFQLQGTEQEALALRWRLREVMKQLQEKWSKGERPIKHFPANRYKPLVEMKQRMEKLAPLSDTSPVPSSDVPPTKGNSETTLPNEPSWPAIEEGEQNLFIGNDSLQVGHWMQLGMTFDEFSAGSAKWAL